MNFAIKLIDFYKTPDINIFDFELFTVTFGQHTRSLFYISYSPSNLFALDILFFSVIDY